jgi:hypothetical protein
MKVSRKNKWSYDALHGLFQLMIHPHGPIEDQVGISPQDNEIVGLLPLGIKQLNHHS